LEPNYVGLPHMINVPNMAIAIRILLILRKIYRVRRDRP
jgi:hypothetical protein